MRPLACLRHEEPDNLGVAEDVLGSAGVPVRYVDAWRQPVPSIEEISGLIVLGGGMNADQTAEYGFLAGERDLLGRAAGAGLPVLGICLGAQLLARALGASVQSAPMKELGFVAVRRTPDAERDPVTATFRDDDRMFQWHRDTWELPSGAVLLLEGDAVRNQAFRAGHRAWGVQFHPEIDRALLESWLELSESRLERDWGRSADEVRREADRYLPAQERRAREMFARFAEVIRGVSPTSGRKPEGARTSP